jgi:aldose 1-epimerase
MKPATLARLARLFCVVSLLPLMLEAANYSARKAVVEGIEVVRLSDPARHVEVSIAPSLGNMAYEMKIRGRNILWLPTDSLEEFQANPTLAGVPFLAPWANRIDGDAYWVNGKKYLLNPDLGNLRRDNHQKPIHGLLNFSPLWKVVDLGADAKSAWVSSRIEFWRHPELMAQFPFAHNVTMTYRLLDGELEVETLLENLSTEPMPVAIGYHPYFRLHDAPRDGWKVHLAARDHMVLNKELIPTGESYPSEFSDPYPLDGHQLDDVFTNLIHGADGRARFWVEGKKERVVVEYGPKYTVAVVYAPPSRDFICFEPMAAITNAFNLAHSGAYKGLQSVPAGGSWKESFWIGASGF